MDIDERWMRMALDLASRGAGRTSPNPMVGAVIVKGGEVIATGYHRGPGTPHAEAAALDLAGEQARGACLYVSLEPCCHYGRTPPCTEKIIRSGVRRVVAAMEDPNPLVAGKGLAQLREAGIEVKTGVLEEAARHLNEVFVKYITSGLPFVAVKTAMALDGKIATRTGASRWLTGEKSREFVHRLRDRHDAVMVGIETVLKDDPLLTTRLEGGGKDAARVVVDSRARLPLTAKVINSASAAPLFLLTTEQAPADRRKALADKGVIILEIPSREGRVDLAAALRLLAAREIASVLVEGGGTLNYGLLEQGLVDKLYLFIAPLILGGREAPTAFAGGGVAFPEEAWSIKNIKVEQIDRDLLITGYIEK